MYRDTATIERPITAPKPRGGMFAVSLLYLLITIAGFWTHPSLAAIAALVVLICTIGLCAFQFGSRTFDPIRAEARTASLTSPTLDRLRRANTVLSLVTAILALAIAFVHFVVDRHFLRDSMIFVYLPIFLWIPALTDFIGDPPRTYVKGSFGRRTNWSDLKPIHSDHWGNRA